MLDCEYTWHDGATLTVEGKGWADTEAFYDRLPARAKGKVRPEVWDLSRNSAGIALRLVTDAPTATARWTLRNKALALRHMPANGVSGIDVYVRHEGGYRWLSVASPGEATGPDIQADFCGDLEPVDHEMMLYLPVLNGVESVSIGVPAGSRVAAAPPRTERPVCFYGTSIVHGGCASRPGMTYVAIVGRRLDRPVLNLGFSGNGKAEPEVAELLAELDPAAYVIDPLPNLMPEEVRQRIEPFVKVLRAARPATPIVLVESILYQDRALKAGRAQRCGQSNRELSAAIGRLRDAGVDGLHCVAGDELLGDDGDGTVDGTHPNDLGFWRMAGAIEPIVRAAVR